MTPSSARTPEGGAATDLVLAIFRANGVVLAAGGRLAAQHGLTAGRWQVLGAVALAGRPLTASQIARRMGLTRQSVQATVNRLLEEALVAAQDNPDHRRSPLIALTELGRAKYAHLDRQQARWINQAAAGLKPSELRAAAGIVQELITRLDPRPVTGGRNK